MAELDPVGIIVAGTIMLFLFFYGFVTVRRFHLRAHVWIEMRLNKGEKELFLNKPDLDGSFDTIYGIYKPSPHVPFEMFNGGWFNGGKKQIFTFYQGDPRPIRYTQTFVFAKRPADAAKAANGANPEPPQLVKVSVAGHQVIPAETLSVYMKQKLFADVYQNRSFLYFILIVGMVILVLLMVAVLAKVYG